MQGFTRSDPPHPNAPRDPRRNENVELVVNLHREGEAAILVSLVDDGEGRTAWLPRSQIAIDPHHAMGPHGVTARIHVPRWLAEEKGLIALAGEGQGALF